MSPRLKGSKSLKSDETREHIYASALKLFRAQGFENTTMRQIAEKSDVATGAAYYYFKSKDEIVLRFYRELQQRDGVFIESPLFQRADGLEECIKQLIQHKLKQLQENRHFLSGVFKKANDPDSALSPFSETTRDIREGNITNLKQVIEASEVTVHKQLKEHLPRLIWFFQMGIILFWFYDKSPDQIRTHRLLEKSLSLLMSGIRLFGLPLLGPLRTKALELLESFTGLSEEKTYE